MKMTMMTTSSRAKAEDQANANAGPDRDGLGLLLSAMAAREGSGIAKLQASSAAAASAAPSPTTGQFFGRGVPVILAGILSNPAYAPIVAWLPRGDAFVVLDPERFRREILPRHFRRVTDFRSFRRKLNRYGFRTMRRATVAAALGDLTLRIGASAFEHDHFRRGRPDLLLRITCQSKPLSSKDAEGRTVAVERAVCSPSSNDANAFIGQVFPSAPAPRPVVERAARSPNGSNANATIAQSVLSKVGYPSGGHADAAIAQAVLSVSPVQRAVISPHGGYADAVIAQALPSSLAPRVGAFSPNAEGFKLKQRIPVGSSGRGRAKAAMARAAPNVTSPRSVGIFSDAVIRAEIEREIERRIRTAEAWRRMHEALLRLPPARVEGLSAHYESLLSSRGR